MVRTGSITSSGAHGYLAAPVQHGGEPPAELEVPAPFGPNWPGLAVAAKAEYGSRCPAGRSAGIVRPPDQGRTLPRASIGFLVQSPLGHKSMVLNCGYSFTDLNGRATPQVTDMGVQLRLGQRPFAHATVPPVPQPTW